MGKTLDARAWSIVAVLWTGCALGLVATQRFRKVPSSDRVRRDLTPVVAGKEAGASWNARGMENALDF